MTSQRTYGETALLTPANMMTAFRLLVAPVFIYMIVFAPDLVVDDAGRIPRRGVGLLRRHRRAPPRHHDARAPSSTRWPTR